MYSDIKKNNLTNEILIEYATTLYPIISGKSNSWIFFITQEIWIQKVVM